MLNYLPPPPFVGPTVRERIYCRDREDKGRRREKRSFNLGFLKFRISGSWGILNIPGPFPGRTVWVLNYRCFFTFCGKKNLKAEKRNGYRPCTTRPHPFPPFHRHSRLHVRLRLSLLSSSSSNLFTIYYFATLQPKSNVTNCNNSKTKN